MSWPANVQAQPLGLLDLLRIKNLGQNPGTMSAAVVPTFDLRELYASEQFETVDAGVVTFSAANTIDYPNLTVPPGQVWWIDALTFVVDQVSAATSCTLQCAIRTNVSGGTFSLLYPSGEQAITAVGDVGRCFVPTASAKTLIMTPNDRVTMIGRNFTGAGTIGIRAYARFTRLAT